VAADPQARTSQRSRELLYQVGSDEHELTAERLQVLERVRPHNRVLEMGAATGFFTRLLLAQGHDVVAVEGDPRAVEVARRRGVPMIEGNLDREDVWARISGDFDAVLFMHVLEHLVDPWTALARAAQHLAPGGVVISLLPNVAAWRVRKDHFFRGSFEYTDTGILDRTHLRFFTLDSGLALHRDAGLRQVNWRPVDVCPPLERRLRVGLGLDAFANRWTELMVRRFPNLCVEIIEFEARP
jgi:SAM-dependent methyltransferase